MDENVTTSSWEILGNTVDKLYSLVQTLSGSDLLSLDFITKEGQKNAAKEFEDEQKNLIPIKNLLIDTRDQITKLTATENQLASDSFQGIRFYDGTYFGYLRIKPDKVELLVGENLEFPIDGTKPHIYRITGKGKDIKLYIDGQLAIDGTGKFVSKTQNRLIEFGDISGKNQAYGSAWNSIKTNTLDAIPPNEHPDAIPQEIISVPNGSFGAIKSYNNSLYASFDPDDSNKSSVLYKYQEGYRPELRPTIAITKSNVSAIIIDPNRKDDVFGTSGKYIGTDLGIQYVIGNNLDNVTLRADMDVVPEEQGWQVLANCEGTCHNLKGRILTIDTKDETGLTYFDYRDPVSGEWDKIANNNNGWTVEANVRIQDDGTASMPSEYDEAFFDHLSHIKGKDVVFSIELSSILTKDDKNKIIKLFSYVLRQLNRWDKFNVVIYGQFDNRTPVETPVIRNTCRTFSNDMLYANKESVQLAIDFVKGIYSSGIPSLFPDVWAGASRSLDFVFSHNSKYVIIIGSGFSYLGPFTPPFDTTFYGTSPVDTTKLSYNTIPPSTGQSIVKNIKDKNNLGPKTKIITIGVGSLLDSINTTDAINIEHEGTEVYQNMWSLIASDSNGFSYRIRSIDDPDSISYLVSLKLDPDLGTNLSPNNSITPEQSAIYSYEDICKNITEIQYSGVIPPEDGICSPGIVINDGTFQEVVQFFQKGIRLKYSRIFIPIDLSKTFKQIRIIGKKEAIAIYAKDESESEFSRILFVPNGLFVKSNMVGDVERPSVTKDKFLTKHVVWQEAPKGVNETWGIYYSRTSPSEIIEKGVAFDPQDEKIIDILNNRTSFGLSPSNTKFDQNILKYAVVSGVAQFKTNGVRVGDHISLFNFINKEGHIISKDPITYLIKEVIDETVVLLEVDYDIYVYNSSERWHTSEYVIYRGDHSFGSKVKISTQVTNCHNPSMLTHSSGDIYVTYENNEKGSFDIYVRRGTATPSSTAWKEISRITRGSGNSHSPYICEIFNDKIFIVWEEQRSDKTRSQIFYTIIDPQIFTDKPILKVVSESSINARNPKAIYYPNTKETIVFWKDDMGTGIFSIYAQKISGDNGNPIGTPIIITSGGNDYEFSAALNISKEQIFIVWCKIDNEIGKLWSSIINANSLNISNEEEIVSSIGSCRHPCIVIDNFGNVFVSFDDDRVRKGHQDIYVAIWSNTYGQWISSGQYGMDIRVVIRGDNDSFDYPSIVPENSSEEDFIKMFIVARASNTGSDSKMIGTLIYANPNEYNFPLVSLFTFDENNSGTSINNRAKIQSKKPVGGTSLIPTNVLYGINDHGFYDIDPVLKSYFDITNSGIQFSKYIVPENGSIDLWIRPKWGSSDPLSHFIFGNNDISSITPNSFSLSYVPNKIMFRIVDKDGYIRSTEIQSTEFSWSPNDNIKIRAKWDTKAIGISKINSVCFKNSNTGYICGAEGSLYKTSDGGITWNKVNLNTTYDLYCIDYVDTGIILVSSELGTIFYSNDDGLTWSTINTGVDNDLYSIYYDVISGKSWAIGCGGIVLKSSDIINWKIALESTEELYGLTVMSGVSGRVVLICGTNGIFYRSTDGTNFSKITSLISSNINNISKEHYSSSYVTFACGDDGTILRTDDSGNTWSKIEIPYLGNKPPLYCISHVSDIQNSWYAVGQNGSLVKGNDISKSCCNTALIGGTLRTIEAQFGVSPVCCKILAGGSGSSYFISNDGGVVQSYNTIKSGNLSITINGRNYNQTRIGDAPFSWNPETFEWYLGNYPQNGLLGAFCNFYQLAICRSPGLNETAFRRKETWNLPALNGLGDSSSFGYWPLSLNNKRVEWGSLYSKSITHWKNLLVSPCEPRVPLRIYAFTTQLGLAGDLVNDLSFDKNGYLFVATGGGISVVDSKTINSDIQLFENNLDLPENKDNRISNITNLIYNLPSDFITSIAVDDDGDVWFGTQNGLCYLGIGSYYSSTESEDMSDPLQKYLKEINSQKNKYSGNASSENNDTVETTKFPQVSVISTKDGIPSNNILTVRSIDGKIYVGTDNGLLVISKIKSESSSIIKEAQTITQQKQSESTSSSTNNGSSTDSSSSSDYYNANITIKIDIKIRIVNREDGLPSNRVQALFYHPITKEIWIGTDFGAVKGIIENDVKLYTVLTNKNIICGKYWDDGMLISTDCGLINIQDDGNQIQIASDIVGNSTIMSEDIDFFNKAWLASSLGIIELSKKCGHVSSSRIGEQNGLLGNKFIVDFKNYRILGDRLPSGSCEKALIWAIVNGKKITSGFDVFPNVPMISFHSPLRPTDKVYAYIHQGIRRINNFNEQGLYPFAFLDTDESRFDIYRKRFRPGDITLGGNKSPGSIGIQKMYSVFALPANSDEIPPVSNNWPISNISGTSPYCLTRPVAIGNSIYSNYSDKIKSIPNILYNSQVLTLPREDDQNNLSEYITITIATDSIIYVAYDSRATDIPSWLRSFEKIPSIQRISDMETYTNPNGENKLYLSTKGTNGCVYSLLDDPYLCDISAEIAMDNSGPDGCINSASMTSNTSMRLNLSAKDSMSNVSKMRISTRNDFKDQDGNDVDWIPFSTTYDLYVPITESTITEEVSTITTGYFKSFYNYNGQMLVAASNPGRIYKIIPGNQNPELVVNTGEQEINSLFTFGKYLIIGTGINGIIFAWDGHVLKIISVPEAHKITAISAFDNMLFIGASIQNSTPFIPQAYVYTMTEEDVDHGNAPSVFKKTMETEITGFAIFGGMLYWTSSNESLRSSLIEIPSDNLYLSTTTSKNHKHTIIIPSGIALINQLNGETSSVQNHHHMVINGIVQEFNGHTHVLNGIMSGKVFRYEQVTDNVIIVHADKDYKITSISSNSMDDQGLLFIGTYPNGKILRYIPSENIFIKSFDTIYNGIEKLKVVENTTYALAGNDLFIFNGYRWEFVGSTGGQRIIDIISNNGVIYLLSDIKIQTVKTIVGKTTQFSASRRACAYVSFMDEVGNESSRFDKDGNLKDCYYVCIEDNGYSGSSGYSGISGSSGNNGEGVDGSMPLFHKITEVNNDAIATMSISGPNPFMSANKLEKEIGIYLSEIFNGTTSLVQWMTISWDSIIPPGTNISFQVRSSSNKLDISKAVWSDEFTGNSGQYPNRVEYDISNQRGQYFQFKAILRCVQERVLSPQLEAVFIKLRIAQAVHYYTTNFVLPENLKQGILTWNGCKNPPSTDIVFGICGTNTTDFSDYHIFEPNKVFDVPSEHQNKNLRIGIKLISDQQTVPIVDEFAFLFSMANDAIIRLNLPGMPSERGEQIGGGGSITTVMTDAAQGHTHTISYDAFLDVKAEVNGTTSINAGHSHDVVGGVIQPSAGHMHNFTFESRIQ